MSSIQLEPIPTDDLDFVELVSRFVSHAANTRTEGVVRVVHIVNMFGRRWLGFCGKYKGAAGVRQRQVAHTTFDSPPFKPSRVLSVTQFLRGSSGFRTVPSSMRGLHGDKPGNEFWQMTTPGVYGWYSGSTASNTSGSLMVYDVTEHGSGGYYIGFERKDMWQATQVVNISTATCAAIMRADDAT